MTLAEAIAAAVVSWPGVQTDHSLVIGESVARRCNGNIRCAATTSTVGFFESRYQDRIQAGQCKRYECDPVKLKGGGILFRSMSYYQAMQHTTVSDEEWRLMVGLEPVNIDTATGVAVRWIQRGWRACGSHAGAISYYAVGHCRWSGAKKRGAFAERVEARLRASVE